MENDINPLKTSVSEGKSLVAAAVTDKGVPTAADDTFQTMADNIGKIIDLTSLPGQPVSRYANKLISDGSIVGYSWGHNIKEHSTDQIIYMLSNTLGTKVLVISIHRNDLDYTVYDINSTGELTKTSSNTLSTDFTDTSTDPTSYVDTMYENGYLYLVSMNKVCVCRLNTSTLVPIVTVIKTHPTDQVWNGGCVSVSFDSVNKNIYCLMTQPNTNNNIAIVTYHYSGGTLTQYATGNFVMSDIIGSSLSISSSEVCAATCITADNKLAIIGATPDPYNSTHDIFIFCTIFNITSAATRIHRKYNLSGIHCIDRRTPSISNIRIVGGTGSFTDTKNRKFGIILGYVTSTKKIYRLIVIGDSGYDPITNIDIPASEIPTTYGTYTLEQLKAQWLTEYYGKVSITDVNYEIVFYLNRGDEHGIVAGSTPNNNVAIDIIVFRIPVDGGDITVDITEHDIVTIMAFNSVYWNMVISNMIISHGISGEYRKFLAARTAFSANSTSFDKTSEFIYNLAMTDTNIAVPCGVKVRSNNNNVISVVV